jgi:hypothetical protein
MVSPTGNCPSTSTVIAESPPPKTLVQRGILVTVSVRCRVRVPDVMNVGKDSACTTIKDAGLGCASHEAAGVGRPGQVVSQSPAPSTLVDTGTLVAVQVQPEPQAFTIPGWVIAVVLALIVGAGAAVQRYRVSHRPPPAHVDVRLRPGPPHVRGEETREW